MYLRPMPEFVTKTWTPVDHSCRQGRSLAGHWEVHTTDSPEKVHLDQDASFPWQGFREPVVRSYSIQIPEKLAYAFEEAINKHFPGTLDVLYVCPIYTKEEVRYDYDPSNVRLAWFCQGFGAAVSSY